MIVGNTIVDGNVTWKVVNDQTSSSASMEGGGTNHVNIGGTYLRQNDTQYSVGDIAYSSNLPSYLRLECVSTGVTASSEPDYSQVGGGGNS